VVPAPYLRCRHLSSQFHPLPEALLCVVIVGRRARVDHRNLAIGRQDQLGHCRIDGLRRNRRCAVSIFRWHFSFCSVGPHHAIPLRKEMANPPILLRVRQDCLALLVQRQRAAPRDRSSRFQMMLFGRVSSTPRGACASSGERGSRSVRGAGQPRWRAARRRSGRSRLLLS
jgi:hypothetical protein